VGRLDALTTLDALTGRSPVSLYVAIGLTAIAIALHVVRGLHAGGLWRDEVAALEVARSPTWTELWAGMT
jgi:hypothetical protein